MSDEPDELEPESEARELGADGEEPACEPDGADAEPEFAPRDPDRKLPHLTQDDLVSFLDEFGRTHYAMEDGRPVCGRLKREHNRVIEDEACLAPPMANGACRVHGGKGGRPIQHGRYSRVLTKLRAAFERARADSELIDARRDLAAMDVLIEQLLERAEELDSPSWRGDVAETFCHLQAAIRSHSQGKVSAAMRRLGDLIEKGATADQLANDLVGNIERRANRAVKIGELELRKQEKVTPAELAVAFRQFLGVLERELEPGVYARLLPELRRATMGQRVEAR